MLFVQCVNPRQRFRGALEPREPPRDGVEGGEDPQPRSAGDRAAEEGGRHAQEHVEEAAPSRGSGKHRFF